MEQHISRDDAVAMFAAHLDEQLANGKSGERLYAVNIFGGRITSVKAADQPPRLKRLSIPPKSLDGSARADILK